MNNSNSAAATASASAAAAASEIMMSPVNEYATEAELQKAFLQRTNSDPDGRGYTSIPSAVDVSIPSSAPGSASLPPPPHGRRRLSSTGDDTPFDLTEDIFHPLDQIRKRKQKWKRELSECSVASVMARLKACVPALTWMRSYNPSTDLLPDVLAGLMLTVVIIPQGMAYAILAGLDPIYGLYACLTPALIYAFFGCSKSMHIGPFALVSLLVANAVQQLIPAHATAAFARDVAFLLSILVGLFLMLMSFLRLGFAVSFLADCVLSAYTCAAAVLIMTSQWKSFLGLTGMPTGLSFVESYVYIFGHLPDINWASVFLGFGSVALLLILDEINARYKFRIPIPSQLLTVLLGILIVFAGRLDQNFHVKVVGHIPSGLPAPHIPGTGSYADETTIGTNSTSTAVSSDQAQLQLWTFANLKAFIQPAATIALIAYIISISIAKNFAMKESEKYNAEREKKEAAAHAAATDGSSHAVTVEPAASNAPVASEAPPNFEIDPNQELFALGLANFIGGFMQCYPAAGSLSRSALVYNSGNKSSLHNVISVILLIFVLLLLTPLLYYLPNAVLAAIVFTALKSLLLQVEEGVRLYHVRKQDFLMWICTFLATLFFDTQVGIAIGLLVSLLMLLKQTSRPPVAILGRLEHTDLYRNIQRFPNAITFRQILIFRFDAPLHFANKDFFKSELMRAIHKSEQREFMRSQPLDESAEHALIEEEKQRGSNNNRSGNNLQRRLSRGLGKVSDSARKIARKLAKITVVGRGHLRSQSRMHEAANLDESVTPALSPPAIATPPPAVASLSVSPQNQTVTYLEQQADLEERKQQQPHPHEHPSSPSSPDMSRTPSPSFSPLAEPTSTGSFSAVTRAECRVHWIVLDCGSLIDIDDSALKMLLALPQQLNVTLVFCALKAPVRDLLSRTHFFDKSKPDPVVANRSSGQTAKKPCIERPFVTVHQAVKSLLKEQQAILALSQPNFADLPSTSMGDGHNPFQSPPSPSMAGINKSSISEMLAADEPNPFETPVVSSITYPPDSFLLVNLPTEANAQLRVPLAESTNVLELVQAVETRTGRQSSEWRLEFLGVDLLPRFPLSTQLKSIGITPGATLALTFLE